MISMKKCAFVFAGQGAQSVGMGKDLAEKYPVCSELFAKADSALGFSLSKLCFEGPIEELTKSSNCQPAIFVMSVACLRALEQEIGAIHPVGYAGLSLGEWTALHAAGVLSFEDTVRILEARGRFMQEACDSRRGGMVSVIGMDIDKLEEIASQSGIQIANINSPGQIVLSGDIAGVEIAKKLAEEAGAKKVVPLNVAGAFHSVLMQPAADKLSAFLDAVPFNAAAVPVISNFTGKAHGSVDEIKKAMVSQVTGSVQWISCVESLKALEAESYLELGPGRVLSGLIKRIDTNAAVANIQDATTLEKAVAFLKS